MRNDIDNRDMMINEEDLAGVTGGASAGAFFQNGKSKNSLIQRIACTNCGEPFYADLSKESCKCPVCRHLNTFFG